MKFLEKDSEEEDDNGSQDSYSRMESGKIPA
jgi:hypothetical protein